MSTLKTNGVKPPPMGCGGSSDDLIAALAVSSVNAAAAAFHPLVTIDPSALIVDSPTN